MEWINFKIQMAESDMKMHKRFIASHLIMTMIALCGLVAIGYLIYINSSSITLNILFGYMTSNFIWSFAHYRMARDDFRIAKEYKCRLDSKDAIDTATHFELQYKISELHEQLRRAKNGFDENKKPESGSQVEERWSYTHQATSNLQPDEVSTQPA